MAKVYDALKQVEVERSRQRLMENETARTVDAVLTRLDAFEDIARRRLPDIERNLLSMLESRTAATERELGATLTLLGNQIRQDVATLHRRLTWLLGAVAIGLAAHALL